MTAGFQKTLQTLALSLALLMLATAAGRADDYVLTLKDHQFTPASLVIPADQKVKLIVKNESAAAAEFESSDLNREKIVSPGSQITVFIGPLGPGSYAYFDDFHRETTGAIVVR